MDGNYKEHWKRFQEDFQQDVKKKHTGAKKRLVGGGEQPNTEPYIKKPSFKRAKSAPVGFGGS